MPIQRYQRQSHPYHNYHHRRFALPRKRHTGRWFLGTVIFVLISFAGLGAYLYLRPLGMVKPQIVPIPAASQQAIMAWPTSSQAAIGSVEQGLLASDTDKSPHPTASTAKLITALTILSKKPLAKNEQGPTITMTQSDIDIYNRYYQKGGSLVQIGLGEKLSERQMLEGMLLPSANNFADSLAIWAFGSFENYKQAAQITVKNLNMKTTLIGSDASGFTPDTQSTAEDLVKLGIAAMKQPVIAAIVAQPETNLPLAGVKHNTNWLLDVDGVVGIKTGNTDEAGGVFVYAAKYNADKNHSATIVGAVQGETTIYKAIATARNLLGQAKPHFILTTPIKKNQVVATYKTPWGESVDAVADADLEEFSWSGAKATPALKLDKITGATEKKSKVGTIKLGNKNSQVVLAKKINGPSWQWRISRPF